MKNSILVENANKKLNIPFWKLICFGMFCIWQMGFIYFMGPSLTLDGRTPLPISMDNITLLIVAGYVCSVAVMLFAPKKVILLSRCSCVTALLTAVCLFIPFSVQVLTGLIYLHCFCCCFMIGFETATIVYFFSEKSAVIHLLAVYPIGCGVVAVLQNDFVKLEFYVFRILTVAMLLLLTFFFFTMPSGVCPRFVKKTDDLVLPKRFFTGVFLLVFLGSLLGVIGPAVAEQVTHGVVVFYIGCAFFALSVFVLYKITGKHPLHLVVFVIVFAAVGYLLFFATTYAPKLALPACFLMGAGMTVCSLSPLFGVVMAKEYPSRFIAPGIIVLALVAVIVHTVLIDVFRDAPVLLNLTYLILMLSIVFIYLLVEPYLLYAMKRSFSYAGNSEPDTVADAALPTAEQTVPQESELFEVLTKRETEVVHLISIGYTNADIAKMLFISEHTVKDHIKNIYRKMQVHNRLELIAKINRLSENRKQQ